jgi:AcrR family transcriptional regulator
LFSKQLRGRPRQTELDRRILEAALRLLAERGYAHMSLDDVASAARTTRATIYLRYASKAALVADAIMHARGADGLPKPNGNLRQDLVTQLRHFRASMDTPYSLAIIGSALAEERAAPELLATLREHIVRTRREMLRTILHEAQARNELAPQANIEIAVSMLIGSYYALAISGAPIPPDWSELLVDQVLNGLLPG